jgi:hypothetical protein
MTTDATLINWDAVSAIAGVITAGGVILALWQLRLTKVIAQLQFEDSLAKEYRDLAARIPTKAFYGWPLTEDEHRASRDEFFRYIDLSNEQVALRQRGRISSKVWTSWCAGIKYNLQLRAFQRAWEEVKKETKSFDELRRLERDRFAADPRHWRGD